MTESKHDDVRRGWDALYSMANPVPSEPDSETSAAVSVLRDLVGDGPVLELAVGNGRVAIPLAATGVDVDGIDYSVKGIEQIRAHPEGRAVKAEVADISSFTMPRKYSLVYLVFNTIQNLTSQEAQLTCFERVAAHLHASGRFVVENGIPDLQRLRPGSSAVPITVADDHIALDEYTDRTHRQQFRTRQLYRRKDGSFAEFSAPFRYVWPSELDLMARLAGMSLEARWASWDRSTFTGESLSAVSVWKLG